MRIQVESWGVYRKAHRKGKRSVRKMSRQGANPYLLSLDSFLSDDAITERVNLGVMDIPTEKIVGVATPDKQELYSYDFLPLSNPDTDFSTKWCKLYWYYLSNKGVRCPISCYEYMGQFYIVDGIKRVSIAKCHGVPTITASVIRLLPQKTEDVQVQRYYEFLNVFDKTGLYQTISATRILSQSSNLQWGLNPTITGMRRIGWSSCSTGPSLNRHTKRLLVVI